jgi:hypothetical protein
MLEQRILELQALSYKEQRAIAEQLGLVKPSGTTWDEFCETIALREQSVGNEVNHELPTDLGAPKLLIEKQPEPTRSFEFSKGSKRRCPVCHEKPTSGNDGALICPIQFSECPRNR